jgi:molybdate transport system substrate-binding protein
MGIMQRFGMALMTALVTPAVCAEPLRVYAAGSLRSALVDIAAGYDASNSSAEAGKIAFTFGASGLLRERIEGGERADVFASADLGHPTALVSQGRTDGTVVTFTQNRMCILARPEITGTSSTVIDIVLDPDIRLGISTPKSDPSGDYAVELFSRIDSVKPGSGERLQSKALQLTGGPSSPKAPEGRNQYGWILQEGQADIFLTYCTNARAATRDDPRLRIIEVPAAISVSAPYGLVILANAKPAAAAFVAYIMSQAGQARLAAHGFEALP